MTNSSSNNNFEGWKTVEWA